MLINLDNAGVDALSGRSKLLLNSVELCSLSSDWSVGFIAVHVLGRDIAPTSSKEAGISTETD